MGKRYVLGLDNGGTVIKAALYDENGGALSCARIGVDSILGENGEVERDMDTLWAANCAVLRETIEKSNVDPRQIAGVSLSGHGNGLYLVDEDLHPVRLGVYSTDARAAAFVKKLQQTGASRIMFEKTMSAAYPGQPGPLLNHLLQYEPEAIRKAKWALGCNDFIRLRLTGEAFGEISGASAAGILNQKTRGYDPFLLETMGIAGCGRLFPPLSPSFGLCGVVSRKASQETGLAEGTPVAGGMIDLTACAIAMGMTDKKRLALIAGTWSINEYLANIPPVAPELLLSSVYCIDGYYLVTDGSTASAGNLEWFVQGFLSSERAQMQAEGKTVYDAANHMVASIIHEESSILFLPFLYGSNVDADVKACFLGITGRHTKAHMLRAIYEGVVFSHKTHVERLLKYRDRPEAVRIAGGAARSRVWVQMFADALGLPVEVSAGEELGTMGAAMCAGVATGVFPSFLEAANRFSNVAYIVEPDLKSKERYAQKYMLYHKAIERLSQLWM